MKALFTTHNFKLRRTLCLVALLFSVSSSCTASDELSDANLDQKTIERVVAVVGCGPNKKIITSSEVGLLDFFNGIESLSLDQIIDQKILLLEAENFKIGNFRITVSQAEVDSKIERAKASFGFPGVANEKFDKILEDKGLSLSLLKDQARQDGMIRHLMSFMFPDKAVVSSEKIEEFCKKNPEIVEEQVRLEACEISVEEFKKLKSKSTKDGSLDKAELEKSLTLCDLGFLTVKELEKETVYILNKLDVGDLYLPEVSKKSNDETVRVLKLVERQKSREKTVDERKEKVSEILYLEDRTKKYDDYITELRGQAHVVRFDQ